jgi:hypothetical protein
MPIYVKKKLQEYNHALSWRMQTCPYSPEPKKIGEDAQTPLAINFSPLLDEKGLKWVQKIVGSILYYAREVDMTVLMALSAIAVEQMKAMAKNNGEMHTAPWLLGKQFGGKS